MKKYKFEILIFIVEAVCMILELVASRVLSPFFGSSQIVWTSVIAIILLSSSIGNYFGGKIADSDEKENKLTYILLIAAVFAFIIPLIQLDLIKTISSIISDIRIGAIFATSALFLAPSIFLGMIPPIILKLKLESIENAGQTAGRINAISTIGSIFGTILGGFFLVPHIGSVQIIFVISVILMLLSFYTLKKKKSKISVAYVAIIAIAIAGLFLSTYKNNSMEERVLKGENGAEISFDTEYTRAIVKNSISNDKMVRHFIMDSGFESATYIDEENKHMPVYEYALGYDLIFNSDIKINNALMIGGAGYSYPRYYISKYKDKTMDVVEIDSKVTEIAKKYFFLNDLIEEYDIKNTHRLGLINEDGRTFLNRNSKKYDAILNDAFSGSVPAKVLTTKEAVEEIKKSLVDGGIYATNIIGSEEGSGSRFIKAEVNTIKQVFKYVYVYPVVDDFETYKASDKKTQINNIVIATDKPIVIENTIELDIDDNEIVITDDYCPVDTLIEI